MNIAAYIDHTILKPTVEVADIKKLCDEAREQHFAAVCVPPYYVIDAKKLLQSTDIKVATVMGFPLGYSSTTAKVAEIYSAIQDGADELDIVHNITALKNNDWGYLAAEITACIKPAKQAGKVVKIIVESGVLTDEELVKCCDLYKKYDVNYIKTQATQIRALLYMRYN